MFDPKRLLDSLLGAPGSRQAGTQAGDPWSAGTGAQPGSQSQGAFGGGGGSLGGLLGDLAGTLGSPEGIQQKAGQALNYARQNPLAAGALLAGVLGTGLGRGLAGSALKYGGLAAIASMAFKAYQDHQAGNAPAQPGAPAPELVPPPPSSDFDPAAAPQGEGGFALALVRAMIAAAKADGIVDEDERRRIGDRARLSGMEDDAGRFLMEELAKPVDFDAIVAEATSEAQRVELYTASRLAINPDNEAERGYLAQLAAKLGLPRTLVDHVEATVASAQAA